MRLKALLLAAVLLSGCALLPVRDTPATVGERLMADVRVLAADGMEGRAAGTPGGAKARAYVLQRLAAEGVRHGPDGWEQSFSFTTRRGETISGVNVVGMVRGRERPDEYIVITAHYDHLGVRNGEIFNGADDNASGVATLLEFARRLKAKPPRHSVLLVAFDAEEYGLRGAEAFVEKPPVPIAAMGLNLNFDMVSSNDRDEAWVAGTWPWPALRPVMAEVAARSSIKLGLGRDSPQDEARNNWIELSDQGPFHAAGVPFLFFSVDDHADYHQPSDDAEKIPVAFFTGVVETAWDAFTRFDAGELAPLKEGRR